MWSLWHALSAATNRRLIRARRTSAGSRTRRASLTMPSEAHSTPMMDTTFPLWSTSGQVQTRLLASTCAMPGDGWSNGSWATSEPYFGAYTSDTGLPAPRSAGWSTATRRPASTGVPWGARTTQQAYFYVPPSRCWPGITPATAAPTGRPRAARGTTPRGTWRSLLRRGWDRLPTLSSLAGTASATAYLTRSRPNLARAPAAAFGTISILVPKLSLTSADPRRVAPASSSRYSSCTSPCAMPPTRTSHR